MNKIRLFILILVLAGFVGCFPQEEIPVAEPTLSELMRERLDELRLVKEAILNDEQIIFTESIGFSKGIPSREALTTEEFQAELKAFEMTYEMLSKEQADSIRDRYEAVVQWCLSCHVRHCPGPVRAIRTLEFDPQPESDFKLFDETNQHQQQPNG